MKKVGIIGSGIVGRVLAAGFLKHGYDVMIGTSDPSKLRDWLLKDGAGAQIGSFDVVADHGDILVLAVKGTAAKSALEKAGALHFKGKTVIDATNPISSEPPVNGVIKYFTSLEESLMEHLQSAFPEVHFVKAFNSVGNAYMVNPDFGGEKPTIFICGNDGKAKIEVTEILTQFGWETEDMGTAEGARAIEPLCMLWCIPGFLRGQWNHAFKLIKAG
jgi:predicted dinucleotide-binding enzyme